MKKINTINLCSDGREIAERCKWYWHDDEDNSTEWKYHLQECKQCYNAIIKLEMEN